MPGKMLYFQTGADDAVVIPGENVLAIDVATTSVVVYANAGAHANVSLSAAVTVTAGEEEKVAKAIAQELLNGASGLITVADDDNSEYLHAGITACGTLTVDFDKSA